MLGHLCDISLNDSEQAQGQQGVLGVLTRSHDYLSHLRHNRVQRMLTIVPMRKILLGGFLGGLVLFVWSAIAHMPPLGTAGERVVVASQERGVLEMLGNSMHERAIYVLPGIDPNSTASEQQAWAARYARGPAAVVAFNPQPADRAWAGSSFATWFTVEFLSDMIVGFLGACIALGLSNAIGFWPRAMLIGSIGLAATIDIDVSYWNWYGFPTTYLLAQFFDHVVGWFLMGLVVSRICRRP